MEMLEPMRPLLSALQGRLIEVFFGFQKVEELMHNFADIRQHIDTWFELMYNKAFCLSKIVGSEEERPRINARQIHRDNIPADTA